jgi:hypothetical protein
MWDEFRREAICRLPARGRAISEWRAIRLRCGGECSFSNRVLIPVKYACIVEECVEYPFQCIALQVWQLTVSTG